MCSGYPNYPSGGRGPGMASDCDHGCDCQGSEYVPPERPPAGFITFT